MYRGEQNTRRVYILGVGYESGTIYTAEAEVAREAKCQRVIMNFSDVYG